MKHIIKFLDYYKNTYGSFNDFPKLALSLGFKITDLKELKELELAQLAMDELFFYEKLDFTNIDNEDYNSYYKKIIKALSSKYLSRNMEDFTHELGNRLLNIFPKYIEDNLPILVNNSLEIRFSDDLLNYEIILKPLDKIENFTNPGLLIQSYYLLKLIEPENLNSPENTKKMQAFSDIFSYYLKLNNYFDKKPKDKFEFLHEYIDAIFSFSYEFEYTYDQNKEQFKATILLSLMQFFPHFIEDINSKEMVSNAYEYINLIAKGNIKRLTDYLGNHEYNPWINIHVDENRYEYDIGLTIQSYYSFFEFDSLQSPTKKYLKYDKLKDKLLNKELQYIYIIDSSKNLSNNWHNDCLILENSNYSVENLELLLNNITTKNNSTSNANLSIIQDYFTKLTMITETNLSDLTFHTNLAVNSTCVLISTKLHISFSNLQEQLKDKITNLNHFHSHIFLSFQNFSREEKLEVYRLFDIISEEKSINPFINITKNIVKQINAYQPEDSLMMNAFLLEQKLLEDIPTKCITSKVKKF